MIKLHRASPHRPTKLAPGKGQHIRIPALRGRAITTHQARHQQPQSCPNDDPSHKLHTFSPSRPLSGLTSSPQSRGLQRRQPPAPLGLPFNNPGIGYSPAARPVLNRGSGDGTGTPPASRKHVPVCSDPTPAPSPRAGLSALALSELPACQGDVFLLDSVYRKSSTTRMPHRTLSSPPASYGDSASPGTSSSRPLPVGENPPASGRPPDTGSPYDRKTIPTESTQARASGPHSSGRSVSADHHSHPLGPLLPTMSSPDQTTSSSPTPARLVRPRQTPEHTDTGSPRSSDHNLPGPAPAAPAPPKRSS